MKKIRLVSPDYIFSGMSYASSSVCIVGNLHLLKPGIRNLPSRSGESLSFEAMESRLLALSGVAGPFQFGLRRWPFEAKLDGIPPSIFMAATVRCH